MTRLSLFKKEADISGAHGFHYFAYPYVKAKHGQEQLLSLAFETSDELHDTHKYLLVHGRPVLMRIDPPLPGQPPNRLNPS